LYKIRLYQLANCAVDIGGWCASYRSRGRIYWTPFPFFHIPQFALHILLFVAGKHKHMCASFRVIAQPYTAIKGSVFIFFKLYVLPVTHDRIANKTPDIAASDIETMTRL
jgi:hypothetical protein